MKRTVLSLLSGGLLCLVGGTANAASSTGPAQAAPVGTRVADFTLPRPSDGKAWSLSKETQNAKAVVILFLGTECPVSNAYVPTLAALHQKYAARGVVFVGVKSNHQDDGPAIARHAREFAIPFAVLQDADFAV